MNDEKKDPIEVTRALEVIEQGRHYASCPKRGMEPCSCVEDAAHTLAENWNRRAPSPVERAKDEVVEAAKNWKAGKWKAQGYPLRDEARLEDALARLSSSEGCAGKEKE